MTHPVRLLVTDDHNNYYLNLFCLPKYFTAGNSQSVYFTGGIHVKSSTFLLARFDRAFDVDLFIIYLKLAI